MGTEGDRRRNRTRRIREKEQKKIKKKWDIPFKWIIVAVLVPWLIYNTYQSVCESILLYKTGVETTAFIYNIRNKRRGADVKYYEFYIDDRRYEGISFYGKLGYTIPVVYLPTNPNINEATRHLNNSFAVMFYKWFNKEHDSD